MNFSCLVDVKKLCKMDTHQCHILTFFGDTVFLKLRIGQFSDTQKPLMVVAECPKIFDVQCIWGRIFVSPEKIFVFKYLQTIFHQFLCEIYMGKRTQELFWVHFFGCPYCSNSTKTHLDVVLHTSRCISYFTMLRVICLFFAI